MLEDEELEQRLGARAALYALWNPDGRGIAVSLDESSVITADRATRARLTQAHGVVHALLRDDPAEAMSRLSAMSGLMALFTALRALTMASESLWSIGPDAWWQSLRSAERTVADMMSGLDGPVRGEVHGGTRAMAQAVARNLGGRGQERILDSVARTAVTMGPSGRRGVGGLGAGVYVAALRVVAGRTQDELVAEHAALLTALSTSVAVTHRDGRLVVDGSPERPREGR